MSKHIVKIYQIPLGEHHLAKRNWISLPYESAISAGFNLKSESYMKVADEEFESDASTVELLSVLRETPQKLICGFGGRSISTSDILVIDGSWYYTNPNSFVLIDERKFL